MRPSALLAVVALAVVSPACRESGEACQDDEDNDLDGEVDCADTDCALDPSCGPCGDGVLDPLEGCDDGNRKDGDGCDARCVLESCGDGIVDPGEECDADVVDCVSCRFVRCGNFALERDRGEQCDDGNRTGGDGCSPTCQLETSETCGNGTFDPFEQCEDGNRVSGDGCSAICQVEFCGDGVLQSSRGEQCEPPDGISCDGACRVLRCGDGVVDANEECDDSNQQPGDGCNQCFAERCGNFRFDFGEQCDDGNLRNNDGCSSTCRSEFCGDGVLQPLLGETCDPSDGVDCVSCQLQRVCVTTGETERGCYRFLASFSNVGSTVAMRDRSIGIAGPAIGCLIEHVFDPSGFLNGPQCTFQLTRIAPTLIEGVDVDVDGVDDYLAAGTDSQTGAFAAAFARSGTTVGADFTAFTERPQSVRHGPARSGDAPLSLVVLAGHTLVVDTLLDGAGGASFTVTTGNVAVPLALQSDRDTVVIGGDDGVRFFDVGGSGESALVPFDGVVTDLATIDVDNDGDEDVVALQIAPDRLFALLIDPQGALPTEPVELFETPSADSVRVVDLDADGARDLVLTTGGTARVQIAYGGPAGFVLAPAFGGVLGAVAPAFGDIDDDGDLDMAVFGTSPFRGSLLVVYRRE